MAAVRMSVMMSSSSLMLFSSVCPRSLIEALGHVVELLLLVVADALKRFP